MFSLDELSKRIGIMDGQFEKQNLKIYNELMDCQQPYSERISIKQDIHNVIESHLNAQMAEKWRQKRNKYEKKLAEIEMEKKEFPKHLKMFNQAVTSMLD